MTDVDVQKIFGPLIEQAKTGEISLNVDPHAFLLLDKALEKRKLDILNIQQYVRDVHNQEIWKIGETSEVLTSAKAMVKAFREKAADGPNNAFDTLDAHLQIADELQTLFRTIRERYEQTDADFAAKFQAAKLAQRPDSGGGR
jgi:hypothetical protein